MAFIGRRNVEMCFTRLNHSEPTFFLHKIDAEAHMNLAPKPYNRHLQKAHYFPFVTSYVDGGQETNFTYIERVDEEKFPFFAFVNDDRQANGRVIKFYPAVFGGSPPLSCIHNSVQQLLLWTWSKYSMT